MGGKFKSECMKAEKGYENWMWCSIFEGSIHEFEPCERNFLYACVQNVGIDWPCTKQSADMFTVNVYVAIFFVKK